MELSGVARRLPAWSQLLAAAVVMPAALHGQTPAGPEANQVESVSVTAEPSSRRGSVSNEQVGDYDVVLRYRIRATGERWTLTALSVDDVTLQGIGVRISGSIIEGEWTRNGGGAPGAPQLWSAEIDLPASDEVQDLEVRYTAVGAFHDASRLTLPMMAVDAGPPEPLPGAFEAGVILPAGDEEGFHVTRAFPVDVEVFESPVGRTLSASLPVVPRFLRFDLRPGAPSWWSRISVLEAIATFLIVVFGALGWRHLQRSNS